MGPDMITDGHSTEMVTTTVVPVYDDDQEDFIKPVKKKNVLFNEPNYSRSKSPIKTTRKLRKAVTVDKSRLTMFDLLSYNPPLSKQDTEKRSQEEEVIISEQKTAVPEEEEDVDDERSQEPQTLGPRVKVGPNGEIILDEESLVVKKKNNVIGPLIVEASNRSSITTYSSFRGKKTPGSKPRWSEEETVRFYSALGLIGTDFTLMSTLFFKETRTRLDLRNKFKKEERLHKTLVDKALKGSDLSLLPDSEDLSNLIISTDSDDSGSIFKVSDSVIEPVIKQNDSKEPKKKRKCRKRQRITEELDSGEDN